MEGFREKQLGMSLLRESGRPNLKATHTILHFQVQRERRAERTGPELGLPGQDLEARHCLHQREAVISAQDHCAQQVTHLFHVGRTMTRCASFT